MRPTAASLGVKDILTDCLKLSGRWCVLRNGRPPDPPDPPAAQLENPASPSGVFLWVTRRHRIRPPPFLLRPTSVPFAKLLSRGCRTSIVERAARVLTSLVKGMGIE